MKNILLAITLVSIFLLGCLGSKTCGTLQCESSEKCCNDKSTGYRCYNTSQYSCLNTTGGQLLCGYINGDWYPASACGDTCYDSQFYTCCKNKIYGKSDLQSNPCVKTTGDKQACSPACVQPAQCCNDTFSGPVCYNTQSYVCVGDNRLCPLENGTPNLACGSACYNPANYTCCNNKLFSKSENSTCNLQGSKMSLNAIADFEIQFNSVGFQYPPQGQVSTCNWNALAQSSHNLNEVFSCSAITGSGAFSYNQSYYVVAFALPANLQSYNGKSALSLYIDNSQGKNQTLELSVFSKLLTKTANESGTAAQRDCTGLNVYSVPLFSINTTVVQGFVGHVSLDVSPLLTWFSATNNGNKHEIQLAVSAVNVCLCLESDGQCIYTLTCDCNSPSYHLQVGTVNSAHPPKLQLV